MMGGIDTIVASELPLGLGYNEIKDRLPPGIQVACHNSGESCTLSGPEKEMQEYIGRLKERGIFAKLVNVADIAYHSEYIAPAAPALLRYLKEVGVPRTTDSGIDRD